VHGKPWTSGIGYHEVQDLAMCLTAACLIVVTYLSGLRPAEALNLRTGYCPAPDGSPRQWTVIPPVHAAVTVLEQLTTTRFLFSLRPAWLAGVQTAAPRRRAARPGMHGHRRRRGEVITAKAANYRIADFISWVNNYARRHGLDTEAIPADPAARSPSAGSTAPSPGTSAACAAAGSPWPSSTATCAPSPRPKATAGAPATA
jgi:hypothetical protein